MSEPKQLYLTSPEKNTVKRELDPEFQYEQKGKKTRKVGEEINEIQGESPP